MVISRRAVLAGLAAGIALPRAAQGTRGLPFGIQLYTVGEALRKDFAGTLMRLAAMGYTDVELADTLDKSATDLRAGFAAAGLMCRSMHVGVDQLESALARTADFARALGVTYVICPFPRLANLKAPTRDEWLWHADFFNRTGAELKNAGLQFGYHNHNIEFTRYGNRSAFDELIARTDPALVKFQLDCGWAAAAGLDPAIVLARYPGRIRLLHVKDVKFDLVPNTALEIETTAIGAGFLDWANIFDAAQEAGVVGYYVELEPPSTPDPMAAAKQSREFLATL